MISIITVRPSKDASKPFYASFTNGAKEYSATGRTLEEAVGRLMIQSGQWLKSVITVSVIAAK